MHASYILHSYGYTSIHGITQHTKFAELIFIKQVKMMTFCVKLCFMFFHNLET